MQNLSLSAGCNPTMYSCPSTVLLVPYAVYVYFPRVLMVDPVVLLQGLAVLCLHGNVSARPRVPLSSLTCCALSTVYAAMSRYQCGSLISLIILKSQQVSHEVTHHPLASNKSTAAC